MAEFLGEKFGSTETTAELTARVAAYKQVMVERRDRGRTVSQ